MSEADKTAHTPGPWEAVPQNGAGPMIAHRYETGNQMRPTGLRLIAHLLERRNSLAEDQANANLIAAAPDMLHALKAFVSDLRQQQKMADSDMAEIDRMLGGVLHIIAKAEGRAP